jgi:predicted alpha/beta hydrolase
MTIQATDGLPLAASLFRCQAGEQRGTLLIAGAVGNVRQNYAEYAAYIAAQGWDAVLFDYRGIGGSKACGPEAAAFTMLDWGEKDLAGVIDWAQCRLHTRRLVLVGHSIGGQLAGLAANNHCLTALVAVAAQRGYWRYWDGWRKYVVYLFWRLYVPLCLKAVGYLPMKTMELEDLPGGVARDWARWGLKRHYEDAAGSRVGHHFARFTAPILAMSFSDDPSLAPPRAVDALFSEYYVRAPMTRWHIRPEDLGVRRLGHSGFFTRRVCPERLWQATAEWMRSVYTERRIP